ncbi:MAG: hypothetical protein BWK73_09115 [Thiothrix lacustris]|uniref:Uncharacterized protein n=1 Tax=Thiothrix lacustris TaxID=525917 RepID=A0A1Y1QV18_9GAMM|nr:MAG: hypothetical protein BWK73_09115 [Thiothrix lacustris]
MNKKSPALIENVTSEEVTAFLVETYRQSDTYGGDFYPAVAESPFDIPEDVIWAAWDHFNN